MTGIILTAALAFAQPLTPKQDLHLACAVLLRTLKEDYPGRCTNFYCRKKAHVDYSDSADFPENVTKTVTVDQCCPIWRKKTNEHFKSRQTSA